jgi:hypothetical protein
VAAKKGGKQVVLCAKDAMFADVNQDAGGDLRRWTPWQLQRNAQKPGSRPNHSLAGPMTYRRDIILSLCLKMAGLALLQTLLAADASRQSVNAQSTASHVVPLTGDGGGGGGGGWADHDR